MKIEVNKEATQQRLNDEATKVIDQARKIAESGRDTFRYPSIRGEVYNSFSLVELVEDLTENTVYKSRFHNGEIIFKIG